MINPKLKYFMPVIFWAAAITLVSSIPNLSAPKIGITFTDKLAHFAEYFVFGVGLAYGLRHSGYRGNRFLTALLLSILFGAIDELHQSIVPGRSMEIWDLLADTVGAICGSGLYIVVKGIHSPLKDTSSQRETAD